MKLLATYHIEGIVRLITGLHIGSGEQGTMIGGISSPVIKTVENKPYIPGSSLKGKVRSELEWKYGNVKKEADKIIKEYDKEEQLKKLSEVKACKCGNCYICQVFGFSNPEIKERRPTRAIFRDLYLKDLKIKTEIKVENTISRITSDATPRNIERVPLGSEFELRILLKVYEGDSESLFLKTLFDGLHAVEESYLGGNGSRGYGQVEFHDLKVFVRGSTEKKYIEIGGKRPIEIVKYLEEMKTNSN